MQREHDPLGNGEQQVDEPAQPGGVVDVRRAVGGRQDVGAGLDAGTLECAVVRAGARRQQQRNVDHDVTDELDPAGDALAFEVRHGSGRGTQQQVGQVIGQDTVELLRHRPVE